MICAEAKELLESYVKGSTDAAAREALEAHFATCEGCRLEVELTRSIHTDPNAGEADPLALESLETTQLSDEMAMPAASAPGNTDPVPTLSAPGADADEEISFADLALEVPESMSTASAVPPPVPQPNPNAAPRSTTAPGPVAAAPKGNPARSAESKPASPAWHFEPVDPPRESTPPTESLNLAEQAFSRKAEAKAKGKVAALRVVLWAAGGLSGLALLGVSIWIALAFNQPTSGESAPPGEAPSGASVEPGADVVPPVDASSDSISGTLDPGAAPADPAEGSQQAAQAIPDGSVQGPGGGVAAATPSEGRMLRAGSLPVAPGTVAAPQPKTAKSATSGSASRSPSTGAKSAAATAPTRTVASRPATGSPAPGSETPSKGTTTGGSRKALGPKPPPDDLEPVTDESEIPFTTAPRREVKPTPNTTGSTLAGGTVKPAPSPSGSTTTPGAGPEAGTAPADSPPAPAPSRPIDRLHLATVQATTAEDLDALRKLKVSWKGMIRTATASDRARAKREYADCLWAIQELSGRTADRREALAAYREYVLYAPAGANDSRTIGRMRFLEDVLAESE